MCEMIEHFDLPKIIYVELETSFDFDTFNQFFSWMTKHIKQSEKKIEKELIKNKLLSPFKKIKTTLREFSLLALIKP